MSKGTFYPPTVYHGDQQILVAVDSVIFGVQQGKLHLLLFKREIEPLAGEWSLIGSFVRPEESVNQAAARVLREITGLTNLYMKQFHCFGDLHRDPGGRVISIAYWSLIRLDQNTQRFSISDHEAMWVPFSEIPSLVLDHNEMVNKAIGQLREQARFHPIGFELLPEEFTLRQLLSVYEAIFNTVIDDRNFRKKILGSGLLMDMKRKDMTTSKKGSFLYRFDEQRYQVLQEKGYHFDFSF